MEPGIDVGTRTLQLKAKAANPGGKLLPGSFVSVSIPLVTIEDALLVPTQAVIPILKGKQVFVAANGKANARMIETSARTDSNVLVTSGLKVGDTVLTSGMMMLKDQMPVKVKVAN
jgi:membrane fusion protein (multidrug efflux system)